MYLANINLRISFDEIMTCDHSSWTKLRQMLVIIANVKDKIVFARHLSLIIAFKCDNLRNKR